MSAPQQNIGEGRDLRALSELARDRGADFDTARAGMISGGDVPAPGVVIGPLAPTTSRTPFSFAVGLHPLADRREGLFPRNLSRHPFQKSPRQCAVQSRRPMVAGRTRLAGQNAVADTARDPIHAHRPVPTLLSPDNAVNITHHAAGVAFDQNPKMNRPA